jgi:hypothetical protein
MSISTEKDLLDDGKNKEGTPYLSKSLSKEDIESEYDEEKFIMKMILQLDQNQHL